MNICNSIIEDHFPLDPSSLGEIPLSCILYLRLDLEVFHISMIKATK